MDDSKTMGSSKTPGEGSNDDNGDVSVDDLEGKQCKINEADEDFNCY